MTTTGQQQQEQHQSDFNSGGGEGLTQTDNPSNNHVGITLSTNSHNNPSVSATGTSLYAFRDHYSSGESTELRFRGNGNGNKQRVHVMDDVGRDQQLVVIIEEKDNKSGKNNNISTTTTIQANVTGTFGTALLRTIYVIVSFFVLSVLFAFSIQCILFLFMNVVGTYTPDQWTSNPPVGNILGCIVACPLLLYSLSSVMTMSWASTVDCWRGISSHPSSLLRNTQFTKNTATTAGKIMNMNHTEWITLSFFLGVPLFTFAIAIFVSEDWYEQTLLVWAGSVLVFQFLYMELCICNELTVCFRLLQKYTSSSSSDNNENNKPSSLLELIKTNLLLTQRQKYSGVRSERYLVNEGPTILGSHLCRFSQDESYVPVQIKYSFGTRLTKVLSCCCYTKLEGQVEEQPQSQSQIQHVEEEQQEERNNNDDSGDEVDVPTTAAAQASSSAKRPKRNFTIDELFGNVMICTKNNWSMERLWCVNPKRIMSLTIIKGEGSVTLAQFRESYVCFALTMLIFILILTGFLVWLEKPLTTTFVIVVLVVLCCFCPMVVSLGKVRQRYNNNQRVLEKGEDEDVDNDDGAADRNNDAAVFDEEMDAANQGDNDDYYCETCVSVWENVRITELNPWACYTTVAVEIVVFFLWPVISLFVFENTPIGVVFLILGIHSIPRHYFNVSNLLQELGSIDNLDLSDVDLSLLPCCGSHGTNNGNGGGNGSKNRDMKNKTLVANLVRRVTRSRANGNWMGVYFFCFLAVFIGYYLSSSEEMFGYAMGRYKWKGVVYANDFYWEPQPQLPYPTCAVQKGFSLPGEKFASLASYSFLSTLTFSSAEESQPLLDQWFGNGTVIDDYQYVDNYRKSTGTENHPVTYKLFTIPDQPTFGIVGIRGSEAMWDWMVDIQLWAGGLLAQIIKNINPFGFFWEPILDEVVYMINSVQSKKLKELSYYRFTSEFIETLYDGYDGRKYENLRVTGASLGGGLAILTGAITGASAISFSGLNAMFSRRTFLPPITKEQLDTRVFNTIPQRDIIANIDKPGMLYQRMQCRGPKNSLFACHSMFRTLCEIQYQCGSQGKPINCWCVSNYGYPIPTQNGTATWEETCSKASNPPVDDT